jgi:raffinose/stachyose/melibiose transport system permease protein
MNTTALVQEDGLVKIETKKIRRRFRLSTRVIFSYTILLILAAVYLGPLAMLVNTSFMSQREFNRNATSLPETIKFENYTEAWEKANFSQYLVNSAIYATTATLIFVFTAVFVAFPIARGYIKGGNAIFLMFVIALFLPPALIPQFQLILRLGLYNTRPGYILLLVTNPVGIIILVNYLKSLPRELDESAAMDGCGYMRFVFYIVFPLSRPVIATVVVLHAIGIWNELILATIYLTEQNYYPITRGMIVFQGVYGFNWPVLAAGVALMAIPMVVLFLFLQRYIISGLTQGAVKQ